MWKAEPKAMLPSATSSFQSSLNSGGARFWILASRSVMILMNRSCICSGVTLSSLMRRSTLLMNRMGFTFSLRA